MSAKTVNKTYSMFPQNEKDLVKLSRKLNVSKSQLVRDGVDLICEKYGLKAA